MHTFWWESVKFVRGKKYLNLKTSEWNLLFELGSRIENTFQIYLTFTLCSKLKRLPGRLISKICTTDKSIHLKIDCVLGNLDGVFWILDGVFWAEEGYMWICFTLGWDILQNSHSKYWLCFSDVYWWYHPPDSFWSINCKTLNTIFQISDLLFFHSYGDGF